MSLPTFTVVVLRLPTRCVNVQKLRRRSWYNLNQDCVVCCFLGDNFDIRWVNEGRHSSLMLCTMLLSPSLAPGLFSRLIRNESRHQILDSTWHGYDGKDTSPHDNDSREGYKHTKSVITEVYYERGMTRSRLVYCLC